ncbi:receptor-like protein EIX1 [Neltuma alba]|uniref:receptor-like protein EIX1 n=1 Tax=Neltuma alba TaxID=207710 RepID=UPI0010A2D1DF|nr:receptor-like protein EIX1 [Prosopis alba]
MRKLPHASFSLPSTQNLTDEGCIEEERQALLKFRDSFENCSRHVLAWEGKQCCRWKGVKCDGITGHVVKIDLSPKVYSVYELRNLPNCTVYGSFIINYSLSSKAMISSLLDLKHLNYLDLSFIDFQYSPIPLFLGSMKQLQYLNLSNCNFIGRVPHHLGNLTNLQILDVSSGDHFFIVNGTCFECPFVDDFAWVSRLSSLQFIDMSGVYIMDGINSMMQVISNLPLLDAHFMHCGIDSLSFSHGSMNFSTPPSKVQVLNLRGNKLSGSVSKALQNLSSLEFLDVSDNMIDAIPFWLGEFRFLSSMNLARNILSGLFPTAVQNMSSLRFLDLSDNMIDSIPLWLGEFRFLTSMNLGRNRLSGLFPMVIQNMSSLRFLDLSDNSLTSAVPLWLIKRIHHVNLTHNKFSNLQSSHYSVKDCDLTSLYLPDDKFQGETVESFKNIDICSKSDLQVLDLSHNELKDGIESLCQLENLIYLSLSSNLISGPIPLSFGNLSKLRVLILENNQFNGTIPSSLGTLSYLTVFNISGNCLNGFKPDSFWKLMSLKTLDLSNNSMEGTLTEIHLRNLSSLLDLRIGMNKLSVKLAPNWLPPFQLANLQLRSCKIEAPFPQWLRTQRKLVNLDLSDTGIWGPLPEWFQQKDLRVFDLSKNKISGPLPRNLHDKIPNLRSLVFGHNLLNGSIPKSVCKLEGLYELDLSNNKLSGRIPNCLGDINWVSLIDLSSNDLEGTIPESFCGFDSHLGSLSLTNNRLYGEIPFNFSSCNYLGILDLGNNQLSGVISSTMGDDLHLLKILRLRQNKLRGSIPSSLCRLSFLQSLDLAGNNLTGTIPGCIGNLKAMIQEQSLDLGSIEVEAPAPADGPFFAIVLPPEIDHWDKEHVKQVMKGREFDFTRNLKFVVNLDLSNNSLIGFIPKALTSLTKLVSLNLSHNCLTGGIPNKIGKLNLLESLDVSWNQLAGPLPSSMSSLTFLSHLNVSYNNFSGPIPEGNQFSTLEDSSIYVGNQYLCGKPVLKKCSGNNTNEAPRSVHFEDKNEREKILFYFVVALGFMTGFWGIIALLVFNKSLRYVCFRYMEKIADELYVAVAIRAARLKRMGLTLW